ncbi:MAG: CBS domain-containing protein [Chloroflexi bacterium]|nr:CBS domain-containing protein [Chloroflexota bacterium]
MYGFVSDVLADKGDQVYTVSPMATVRDGVRAMNENGVGALLVVEHGRPVGIFTERDVLRRVVDEGRAATSTPIHEVMTTELLTIAPSTSVNEAMALMTNRRCRHLPVVVGDRVVGMVSIGDLLRRVSMAQESQIEQLVGYISGRDRA